MNSRLGEMETRPGLPGILSLLLASVNGLLLTGTSIPPSPSLGNLLSPPPSEKLQGRRLRGGSDVKAQENSLPHLPLWEKARKANGEAMTGI